MSQGKKFYLMPERGIIHAWIGRASEHEFFILLQILLVSEVGLTKLPHLNRMSDVLQDCGSGPWPPPRAAAFWTGPEDEPSAPHHDELAAFAVSAFLTPFPLFSGAHCTLSVHLWISVLKLQFPRH